MSSALLILPRASASPHRRPTTDCSYLSLRARLQSSESFPKAAARSSVTNQRFRVTCDPGRAGRLALSLQGGFHDDGESAEGVPGERPAEIVRRGDSLGHECAP